MDRHVLREEVQAFMQACQALSKFSRYNGVTSVERDAIDICVQALRLDLHHKLSPADPPLAATLSNVPLID